MNKKIVRQVCLAVLLPLFMLLSARPIAAQETKVTIDMQEVPMKQIMTEIERQTSYLFGVSEGVDVNRKLTLKVNNVTVKQALDRLVEQAGNLAYEISGANIFLKQSAPKESKTIRGTILGQDGLPIPGVSVYVKGHTSSGTVSDLDGKFVLEIPAELVGGELEYNSLGYETVTRPISGTASFDVTLRESSVALEGTVVTALGIRREEKALSYNVQEIKAEEITAIKDANFINSLNGKVAGININSSSSGVGGASRVIMRGMKSIEQSSNALYVIDGIPMYNFRREGDNAALAFDSRGSSESIADLNPDDIESISVLTGAAAAALYGSNAANGAIVITTKKGHVGKLKVSVNSSTELSTPFVLPDFQNRYGTGRNGKSAGSAVMSWGEKLNPAAMRGYEPAQFFNTGLLFNNSVTLSAGNERNQTFFSAAAVNSQGMVPNNAYNRFNFTFRNTTSFLRDKMHLDVGANYIIQNDRNMTNQGWYSNPIVPVYLFPRGDDFSLVKYFERWDPARKINTQYWPQGEGDYSMQNPYWAAYRNLRTNQKRRYMLSGALSYDITDWLNVTGRVRADNTNTVYEQKLYAGTITTLTEGSSQGFYAIEKPDERQIYADVLANVDKKFGDFSLVANIGASIVDNHYQDLSYRGPIRENGIPNLFNVWDLDSDKKRARQTGWREQTQSVFASVELGWKSMLYLTVTGRNDWASQLANSSATSFFYPSVGLSGIISEMAEMPQWIDLLKVRGSFSSVGTPYPRNLTSPTYEYDETTQGWKPKTHYPIGNLKPERTDSYEAGFDLRLFKDFSLGFSWYLADTYNQTFDPKISVSSGYSKIYLQTGSVRNSGIELSLGYGHQWKNASWYSNFTLSHNKNEIRKLVRDYIHPETGQLINKDRLEVGGLGKAKFILKEGGTLGDLYSQSDLVRDDKGMVLIDPSGAMTVEDNLPDIKLGTVFPKANMAWNNTVSFYGVTLSALITARIGGIVYSATEAAMDQYGVSERSALARDNGGVLVNGRTLVNAENYYTTIGGASGIPQYYTYSATNVRLQEAGIGYTIPRKWLGNVCDINISVVGRNLLMIYCKAPFDPETVATTGNYYQGIDNFMLPSARTVGFNLKINF